jgi:hypothetical protein
MSSLNRRQLAAGAIAGAASLTTDIRRTLAADDAPADGPLWTLEGELRVHPKFVYRYFLVLLNGQTCPLYGADHNREPALLSRLTAPARVRVRGTLGTDHHAGSTPGNLSPFPAGWWVYMNAHEVTLLE